MRYLCLLALLATSCSVVAEPRDWNFVQAVGGIAIGDPAKEFGGWVLPVRADVSGLQTITDKPTTMNSALVCASVQATVEGKAIYVTVRTGVVRKGLSSACPPANLGDIKAGSYAVFYRESSGRAVQLREVAIGPAR